MATSLRMIWRSYSSLTKTGLLLLPWFPAAIVFAIVWLQFPATDRVLVETMVVDAPSIHYSAAQQAEQMYPGIHLFAGLMVITALAFFAGLVLLLLAFIRRRNRSHATQTM
jgi:hypothetical protein